MRVAIIPARGGSKRIPRKNIRTFRGKPIIAYSIEAAVNSGCFDRVICSTDDDEIAAVARTLGAEVPFIRPANIADDFATTSDVIKHAIQWLNNHGPAVQQVCCIYATAPFVTADILQTALEQLTTHNAEYAFSATAYDFPIQRALQINEQGRVNMLQPEHLKTRSQDLTPCFHDAGQFYWATAHAFLNDLPIFADHSIAVLIPSYKVQDIDTPDDWISAEAMHQVLESQGRL